MSFPRTDFDPKQYQFVVDWLKANPYANYGNGLQLQHEALKKIKKDTPNEKDVKLRNEYFQATKDKIYFKHPYQTAIELLEKIPKFKLYSNYKKWEQVVRSNDTDEVDFAGGTFEEALEIGNVDYFNSMRERLEKQDMHRKIIPDFLLNRKRRRVKSEVDGDYNYDERWALFPYSTAKKQYLPLPALRLVADFGIHCGYSSDQINAFGAVMWSLSQMLESIGVSTEVVIRATTEGLHHEEKKQSTFVLTLVVKHAGEYLSPIAMTTCFRSVFFRRAMFNLDIMAADFVGAEVANGLGRPKKSVKLIGYSDGELTMEVDVVDCLDEIRKKIEEIFTGGRVVS